MRDSEDTLFKKILMASLAAGALALNAPAAVADPPTFDCGFDSVQNETATGQSYQGAAWGYIVDADSSEPVSIRCYITVDGTEASSTPTGTGTGAATTAGQVSFEAADNQEVLLCAEYSAHGTTDTQCFASEHQDIPPQEVIDAINAVFDALDPVFDTITELTKIPDSTLCPILQGLAGDYAGVISISAEGDVTIAGIGIWDCPPYSV